MSSVSQQKAAIRTEILARRDGLDPQSRIAMSRAAAVFGEAAIPVSPGQVVSGYYAIRSEIDPQPLMDALRRRGARLCLPAVIDRTTIVFRELSGDGELVETGFGTRGPGPEAAILNPQIVIMPLAAFDRRGGRIGYGAGYYDRAIAELEKKGIAPQLFGFAFSCQETENVPIEPHDRPLGAIITEAGCRFISGGD